MSPAALGVKGNAGKGGTRSPNPRRFQGLPLKGRGLALGFRLARLSWQGEGLCKQAVPSRAQGKICLQALQGGQQV